MAQWATFTGLVALILLLLLSLSYASRSVVSEAAPPDPAHAQPHGLTTGMLLANVAFSQGFLGVFLLLAAWVTQIPWPALGLHLPTAATVAIGLVLGAVLYGTNRLGAWSMRRLGFAHGDELRELLAPKTRRGWLLLLVGVLPIIAGFEELLFRAALVGALSAGYGVSPWVLAVLSSLAFALGHGAQGVAGIVVTWALGLVLAAAFVATGSLVVVVVAHYVVNALEFVIHEGVA
ncbi:CPBP family intramembrane glutamic endopeptidase [Haladaptatus sp. YSMS36]|uniref:CPBP family intramembrane glutamic endopeptidase n=1 Tax=Haladaptatus sp. YSMS36 TaxID=3033384 RepID=UPI0023E8C21F|nr:CPBP family intramembrane glutamic endopeptidase [Haladaptatus sp. YSMS36]